jgi:hypothetical protein
VLGLFTLLFGKLGPCLQLKCDFFNGKSGCFLFVTFYFLLQKVFLKLDEHDEEGKQKAVKRVSSFSGDQKIVEI